MSPGSGRRAPGNHELAAAQEVVDLFAAESLLALDRYEQSFPAHSPDKARRTADYLAYWWRSLELDDVRLDRAGTDAEQILAKAADLSLDPANRWGVGLEEASAQAMTDAGIEGRPLPVKSIADLRREFADAYGGRAGEPSRTDDWLAESLTRFRRASVLRDVIAAGAKIRVSEPLREAADDMVRQGRQLIDDRMRLARSQEAPINRRDVLLQQARNTSGYFAWSLGVDMTGAPAWAEVALKAPALALYVKATVDAWREHARAVDSRHDPAQAQLRSVRRDLVDNLGAPLPTTRRDNRVLRNTSDRPKHDR